MSLPRIITLDPTWTISRTLRGLLDIMDIPAVQVDVPDVSVALEEISKGCNLLVTAYQVDHNTKGFEVAMRVNHEFAGTPVIVVGDVNDPEEFDEETA